MLLQYVICLCFCMSKVISSFRSLRAWITGVCSPYVISLCDFAYYVFGQEPAFAMHQYDVCKHSVGSVYIGGLSESGLCVFCELCPVSFLVVGESPSFCCSL